MDRPARPDRRSQRTTSTHLTTAPDPGRIRRSLQLGLEQLVHVVCCEAPLDELGIDLDRGDGVKLAIVTDEVRDPHERIRQLMRAS